MIYVNIIYTYRHSPSVTSFHICQRRITIIFALKEFSELTGFKGRFVTKSKFTLSGFYRRNHKTKCSL